MENKESLQALLSVVKRGSRSWDVSLLNRNSEDILATLVFTVACGHKIPPLALSKFPHRSLAHMKTAGNLKMKVCQRDKLLWDGIS